MVGVVIVVVLVVDGMSLTVQELIAEYVRNLIHMQIAV